MARVSVDDRRLQFVRAAARVIASDGVAAATTRRIAAEAQAPLAALHYCFRNKDELLQEVYHFLSRDYAQALPPIANDGRGLSSMIEAHARRVWARMMANPHEQVTTFELLLRRIRVEPADQPQALKLNQAMYEGWITSTIELFRSAAEDAGEPQPTNLEQITRLFISGVDGISMQHLADPDEARSKQLVELLARSLARSLDYA
ncbi:TetR family transcriptional regulator [Arthrobacter sp. AQ5-06]|nr:TetR family transcriptional regulator [Arthrobacter sp. AQ5-06]